MTDIERRVRQLRARALTCRAAAAIATNGAHSTDRMLLDIAEKLEHEADELEKTAAYRGES